MKRKKKKTKDECLDLWYEAVKLRDNYTCRYCGNKNPKYKNAHHIIPKTNWALRYDLKNGICVCSMPCHKNFFHSVDPNKFEEILSWYKNNVDWEYLQLRRHSQTKTDKTLIKIYLKQEIARMK